MLDLCIVGAQRCATTSLFIYLTSHPNVTGPKGKETHYFDQRYLQLDLDWYETAIGNGPSLSRRKHIEATPIYLFYPPAITRLAEAYPETRIVVMLRDPFDRAYSHYWHVKGGGAYAHPYEVGYPDFNTVMRASRKRFWNNMHFWQEGGMLPVPEWKSLSEYGRSYYKWQLDHLFKHFSKGQSHIVITEEFALNPADTVFALWDWLGVEPYTLFNLQHYNEQTYPSPDADVEEYWRTALNRDLAQAQRDYPVLREVPWETAQC